jgi:hypothetical protein
MSLVTIALIAFVLLLVDKRQGYGLFRGLGLAVFAIPVLLLTGRL